MSDTHTTHQNTNIAIIASACIASLLPSLNIILQWAVDLYDYKEVHTSWCVVISNAHGSKYT